MSLANLESKNLSPSSLKLYLSNLKRLNEGQDIKSFTFLKNVDAIMEKIAHYKPNTQRTYIISIVSLLKQEPKQKVLYDKYYTILMKFNNDLKTNTDKSETQKENWFRTSPMPCWRSSASRRARQAASHNSKCAPMPSNMASRVIPAAERSSGATRMRPEPSISTSCALPSNRRCNARACIGKAAICSRLISHTGRGYTRRQPSGCRVSVRQP